MLIVIFYNRRSFAQQRPLNTDSALFPGYHQIFAHLSLKMWKSDNMHWLALFCTALDFNRLKRFLWVTLISRGSAIIFFPVYTHKLDKK